MWELLEHRRLDRQVVEAPREVLKRYEKWKDIARLSGPPGVRLITGFHDEAVAGKWKGARSSRFGDHWRVIDRVVPDRLTYYIESLAAHDDHAGRGEGRAVRRRAAPDARVGRGEGRATQRGTGVDRRRSEPRRGQGHAARDRRPTSVRVSRPGPLTAG